MGCCDGWSRHCYHNVGICECCDCNRTSLLQRNTERLCPVRNEIDLVAVAEEFTTTPRKCVTIPTSQTPMISMMCSRNCWENAFGRKGKALLAQWSTFITAERDWYCDWRCIWLDFTRQLVLRPVVYIIQRVKYCRERRFTVMEREVYPRFHECPILHLASGKSSKEAVNRDPHSGTMV